MERRLMDAAGVLAAAVLACAGFARAQEAGAVSPKPGSQAIQRAHGGVVPASKDEEKKPSKDWVSAEGEAVEKALEALGESPVATLLEELGPDVRAYQQHVMSLSNPFFEGRAPGTAGNKHAAEYIEFYFRKAGLKPAFATVIEAADGTEVVDPQTSYRQAFRAGQELKVRKQEVVLDLGGGGEATLNPGSDFVVLGSSGNGEASDLPVVSVGYGIEEGENGYSSFEGDGSLEGKIAMVFRFEPMDEAGNSRWVKSGWSPAAALDGKLAATAERKPEAIILVNPPGASDPRAKELMDTKGSRAASRKLGVPVVMMTTAAAERLVKAAEGSPTLMDLRRKADEGGAWSELKGVTASIGAELKNEPVMTDNVAGVLPGKGALAEEYVVIGAHYDHVGYGPIGVMEARNIGKLHPGADDNASGTSGVLMLADRLSREYAAMESDADARSVIFILFSAEESGLNGSRWYVNHPSVALDKIALMINMDMIGRVREGKVDIDGSESAVGFHDWLQPYFEESGLTIAHSFKIAGNTDHFSFYAKKIPVFNLFSGYHREYHTPADEGYMINPVGAVKVLDVVAKVAVGVATRAEKLEYKDSKAPKKDEEADEQAEASPGPLPVKVRFGIAPGDYTDDEPGVLVGEVYDDTSAADAGVKVGDRMIRWNGKELKDVETWMPLLSGAKVGDVVDLVVVRDGKEVPIKVTLKARADTKQ